MNNKRFLSSLKPFIFILKLFGCFPYQINIVNHSHVLVKVSKIQVIYGFLLLIICASYTITYHSEINSKLIIDILFEIHSDLMSILAMICFSANLYNIKEICRIFEEIFWCLSYLNDLKFFGKIPIFTVGFIMLYFSTNFASYLVYYLFYGNDNIVIYILDFMTYCTVYFVINSIVHQFCFLIIYFSKIIEALNDEFRKLIFQSENINLLIIGENDVSKLVEDYIKIGDLFERVNNCYGVTVTLMMFLSFLGLLESLYQFILDGNVLEFVVWFGYFAVFLCFILYSCEEAVNEVRNIED